MRPSWPLIRYLIFTGFLSVWAAAYAADGVWVGDFWAHAAAVRELAAHLVSPGHSQLAVDVPDAFFSPYSWALGSIARLFGRDPISVLGWAGVFNVVLLASATLAFCRSCFGPRGLRIAFWSLVLMVFWWGDSEWFWSGFVHAGVLGYVASYPATFALAASLFACSLTPGWLAGSRSRGVAVVGLLAVVLVTHPLTALFLIVGVGVVAFERGGSRVAQVPLAILVATALAASWPLYPFFDLFVTENAEFHAVSRVLYEDVFKRTYPILLGLPVVLARLRGQRRDVLAWMALGLLVIYGVGYVSQRYGLGRVISPLAVVIQIGLARELVRLEERLADRRALAGYAISVALVGWIATKADGPVSDIFHRRPATISPFVPLMGALDPEDVVVSDLATSWYLPALGPRIVASEHPVYWVSDHDQRRHDAERFFAETTSEADRRVILERYQATYVLVDTRRVTMPDPSAWGELAARDGALVLLRVNPPLF